MHLIALFQGNFLTRCATSSAGNPAYLQVFKKQLLKKEFLINALPCIEFGQHS